MAVHFEGIDLDGLAHDAEKIEFPPVVPGRTVHVDADFLAYQVSYEKETDPKSIEDMQHNAEIAVEALRGLSAAEHVHLHLTPSSSDKGGRFRIAMLKEYQANRKDKPKPRYLNLMRTWMANRYPGTLHERCEADDGMSSAQYAAIAAGKGHLSIIASKDKDLRMVPGLHLDWDNGNITESTEFGQITLIDKASGKSIYGHGQKLFWAQLLTGDTADNISGLPAVSALVLNKLKPTKAILKAQAELANDNLAPKKRAKALSVIAERKAAKVGPVLAYDLIASLTDNRACFNAVKALFRLYGEETGYIHWSTGEVVPWGHALASEAKLLWMRRQAHNENCVLEWWRSFA
jgi:hypothetical protein